MRFRLEYLLFVFFFLAGPAHQLLYLLFPLCALLAVYTHRFEVRSNPVLALFFQFFVFMLVLYFIQATLSNELTLFSAKGVARYFCYYCFALFLSFLTASQIENALVRIIQFFLLLLPYGIYEVIKKDRYELLFGHSNHLAYSLLLLLLFVLNSSFSKKWLYYLGLAFSILLTKSSGATLTMVLLTVLHIFFVEKVPLASRLLIFLAIFSAVAIVFSLFPERILEQWQSFSGIDSKEMFYRAKKHWFGSHGSGVWRVTYWIAILTEFFKSSTATISFGLGLDSMTHGHYAYRFMNIDPHNDYVRMLTETGILGIVFLLYFIIRVGIIVRTQFLWVLALLFPMYFGNIFVSFSYMVLFIILLTYRAKAYEEQVTEPGILQKDQVHFEPFPWRSRQPFL